MKNLTEKQRVGESERQNLAIQLERLDKVIQGKKPEIEPKGEQSTGWIIGSRESKRREKSWRLGKQVGEIRGHCGR